jgi:hypothetical protein
MSHSRRFDFDCCHRIENSQSKPVCLWQSHRLGQLITTTSLFCNQCPLDVYKQDSDNPKFLKKCLSRRYTDVFLNKLYNKYTNHTKIILPDNWNNIVDTFSFLQKEQWYVDIGLTGSYIVENIKEHKDIDIIFWIKDIPEYLNWTKNNELPKTILNNIKTDYYLFLEPHYQFFVSLWPNQKKIFTSKYFVPNISCSDPSIEILYDDSLDKILRNEP